jgi:hypothetical protein
MDEQVRNMDMIRYEYLVCYNDRMGGYCIIVCACAARKKRETTFCSTLIGSCGVCLCCSCGCLLDLRECA